MAYTYDPIFAQDPNNPNVVASNASITIYDPADSGKAPITITDPTGSPLPNPITVDARGMGPAFQHATLDRVAWFGAGFVNYFTSYEGMKNEAKAARDAAQAVQMQAAAGDFKGAKGDKGDTGAAGLNGSNVLPTDDAIEQAIKTPDSKTATALSATYVPRWKANTAYLTGDKVLSPNGDVVSAKVNFTSGANYSAANWDLSATVAGKLDVTTAAASYAKLGAQKSRRPIDPRSVLMPGAPFERVAASTDLPTITFATANPNAAGRVIPFFSGGKVEGSPYFSAVAGADWSQPVLNEATTRAWANQTGAGTRGQHSPASIMFGFDGASITLKIHSWAGNWYRVKVDDQYVTDVNGVLAPSDQTIQYMTLTWSAAKTRRIRIDMRNVDVYQFQLGTTATPSETMWALNPRGPKVLVLADSYAAGNNSAPLGYTGISSWVWTMSDALGWENTINGGIYGTGWEKRSAVDKLNSFRDRVNDVIAWAPDVVIWAGGHNDLSTASATITTAVDQTLSAARAGLPDSLFIVTGPFAAQEPADGSTNTTWKPLQDTIFAAASPYRTVTVDTVSRGIFTGTGRAGTPGTGNGEKYISADIVHPTQAGADYLGRRMAQIIFEAMTKA